MWYDISTSKRETKSETEQSRLGRFGFRYKRVYCIMFANNYSEVKPKIRKGVEWEAETNDTLLRLGKAAIKNMGTTVKGASINKWTKFTHSCRGLLSCDDM